MLTSVCTSSWCDRVLSHNWCLDLNTLIIFPTDILVLLCQFAFLTPCGQFYHVFLFLFKLVPSFPPSFQVYDDRTWMLSPEKSGPCVFGWCVCGFVVWWVWFSCSHESGLDSVNSKALNNAGNFKDNVCILCAVKNLKIFLLMLPYCFSKSHKGDSYSKFQLKA